MMDKLKPTLENQQVPRSPLTARQSWTIDLLGLLFVLTLFYLFYLGNYPLFTPDEGRYSEIAREMIVSGDYITPRVNGVAFLDKPILYYWLQAAAIHLFGISEWSLRFFPMLFGILGCLLSYVSGRLLFDRRSGLLAAIILATTPLYFACAHYANLDLEVAVLISGALLSFLTGIQTSGRWYWFFAAYVFAGLAVLTKGLIGIVFPTMIIGLWILLAWRWKVLRSMYLVSGLVIVIAITLPWYLLVQDANPDFLHYFFITQHVARFLSAADFNNKTPFWFYVPVVIVGFFPWTIFLIQSLKRAILNCWKNHTHDTELFLLLWAITVFVFFSFPYSKIVSYILPIFPPLALLSGRYLSLTWDQIFSRRPVHLAFIFFNLLLALLILSLSYYQWLDISPSLFPYCYLIAVILLANTLASWMFFTNKGWLRLFTLCTVGNVLFLLTLTLSAPHLNINSAKPLTTQLKTMLQPQDEIVNYYKYYQDIPLYLERRVTIVANWQARDIEKRDNWVREFWYSLPFQKTGDWLIDDATFWQRWRSNKRLYVFINANYFSQFKRGAKHYRLIGKYNDIILVTNR